MRAICVDDEELVLRLTISLCELSPLVDEAKGFTRAVEVLSYLEENRADIAILDVDMPDMDGISLAMKIKEKRPEIAVIFLTGYSQYAVDAFAIHASGYLLKPVSRERLFSEIEYALKGRSVENNKELFVRTFGEFDLLIDGKPISFPRAKSKELLAYLVDRQGGNVTRPTIFAALWEDGFYDRTMQKYLDTVIRTLRDTLRQYGVEDILEIKGGFLRICPEKVNCDAYRFFAGDPDAINAFRGEYMSAYSWANMSEAYLDRLKEKI